MALTVREMKVEETDLIVDYFHKSTPEFLEMLGVDPTRLPNPATWRDQLQSEFARPMDQRMAYFLIWLLDDFAVGFSTLNKIVFGDRANMHLHIVNPDSRCRGIGVSAVRQSLKIYFDRFKLKCLFCEPSAFNVAPNRTLQKAGFSYVKTYMTVPGALNYPQAVTQWVIRQ